jgi:hypothetical protein
MRKTEAIELLGGTTSAAAEALGVEYQAVAKWPEELSPRVADRVIAALARTHLGSELEAIKRRLRKQRKQA